jgi:predicted transcriptional regulator
MRNLGELELDVLSFVADHSPITVREVATRFGEPRGLARTTILTVMERLRKKNYLERTGSDGAFEYSPRLQKSELFRGLIRSFADKALGGSLDPLVTYLVEDADLSDRQIHDLQQMIENLEDKRRDRGDG